MRLRVRSALDARVRLAATSEKVTVYASLEARRKTPLPEALREAMLANLVERES